MQKRTKSVAGLVVAAVALVVACLLSLPAHADTAAAAATYKAKCAGCHGADGKGETPGGKAMKAKDFASEDVQKMSDSDLSEAITNGKAKMPPFKSLSADQVKDLVAYVRAFGKK